MVEVAAAGVSVAVVAGTALGAVGAAGGSGGTMNGGKPLFIPMLFIFGCIPSGATGCG